ncbi:pyridoxal phosphate-dependent transferase [Amylocarpus encephaloides]|uniref:Pyridoxal phosphate-dependent transferase n=1 Tax=Amylocarpus encephaloides TaxID=45428 RepID=A0A9P7YRW4_9HELO|nr:pyridoxal phosphate-dependent transferase [Amylocarpus encephaloides]
MAANLSSRIALAMGEILPKMAAFSPQHKSSNTSLIDLSLAENLLIRDELVDIFKSTFQEELTPEAFSLPHEFSGELSVRTPLASFFNRFFKPAVNVEPEHIVMTAGVGTCLEALVYSICEDGDTIIIPGPYWFGFEPYLRTRANVKTIVANLESYQDHGSQLIQALEEAYSSSPNPSRIKAVLLCNPHNPFSQCFSPEVLKSCLSFCQDRGLHVISDELYALASIKGPKTDLMKFTSVLSLIDDKIINADRVHIMWSGSKLLGLSGMRIRLTLSYDRLSENLKKWGIEFLPASEGMFVFAKLAKDAKTGEEADELFAELAKNGVLVSPGKFYNGINTEIGWARITFSVSLDVLQEALARMSQILDRQVS